MTLFQLLKWNQRDWNWSLNKLLGAGEYGNLNLPGELIRFNLNIENISQNGEVSGYIDVLTRKNYHLRPNSYVDFARKRLSAPPFNSPYIEKHPHIQYSWDEFHMQPNYYIY